MKKRRLGNTDIMVSEICLGTMTWGQQNTAAEAFAQMNLAVEMGVNFFDTAELYAIPPRAQTYGKTEEIIGQWLKEDASRRQQLILATKAAGKAPAFSWIRNGEARLDRENITAALEASLQRLNTDYVDLYQLHWPDRPSNRFGALGYKHEEDGVDYLPLMQQTLEILGEFVACGKIRTIGVSNETPWGVMSFLQLAAQYGLPRLVSIQNPYNLLNRVYDIGLAEISLRESCGLLAYSPIAGGSLTGKYLHGIIPAGSRRSIDPRPSRYNNRRADQAIAEYMALARAYDLHPAQMAIAFTLQQPFLTASIIGATNIEQLSINLATIDKKPPAELWEKIDALHQQNPNPSP
ncbi:MAG: aldo/keto reductase [Alphaproteobacteria bacterium]